MNYNTFQPQLALRPFVKCIWTLDGCGGLHQERVLPDGCSEMIFHYGDLFKRHLPNGSSELQPRSFIMGQISQYIQIAATGVLGIIGVRFYPHGMFPFINAPMSMLSNQSVALADIFGNDGRVLADQVLSAPHNGKRIELIESFLMRKLALQANVDFAINDCVTRIMDNKGQIRVDSLRKNLKVSKRHFERKFNTSIGLNPKLFGRLIRFHNATQLIEKGTFTSLAALSYEGGYYDQAHFTRDFKEFTGMNPTAYFKSDHSMNDLFSAG